MTAVSPNATGAHIGPYRTAGSSSPGHAIRSMLALLAIEIRRSQGVWLLPLMIGPIWLLNAFRTEQGVILWPLMTVLALETYVIIGPLTAGLAAWSVDRDRRRGTMGMVAGVPRPPIQRDAVVLGAATFWGIAAYGVMASWFLGRGVLFATWGAPDLGIVLLGSLAVAAHASAGFLAGRISPGRFTPLLAAALTYAIPIAIETLESTTGAWRLWLVSPLGIVEFNDPNVWFARPETYVGESLLWLTGALLALWMLVALLRSRHPGWWIGLGASGVIAAIGLNPLLHYVYPTTPGSETTSVGMPLMTSVRFEPACTSGTVVEVCVHPAYAARLDDTSDRLDRILAPVAGLSGVPASIGQYDPASVGEAPRWNELHGFGDAAIAVSATDSIFPPDGKEGISDAQDVISRWLVEQAGMEYPFPARPSAIDAATEQFAALGHGDQRAWLEANWTALRAGDLTLEDLP